METPKKMVLCLTARSVVADSQRLPLWCSIQEWHENWSSKRTSLTRCPHPNNQTKLQPSIPELSHRKAFLGKQIINLDWNPFTDLAFHHLKLWICSHLLKTTFDITTGERPLLYKQMPANIGYVQSSWRKACQYPSQVKHLCRNKIHNQQKRMTVCLLWLRKIPSLHIRQAWNSTAWS